jgi:predicted transcriptional regulator
MARTPSPTKAELAILRVLWAEGARTVREIHDALANERAVGYTTTLKTVQVMTAKGLIIREERGQQHLYRARYPEKRIQRRLIRELIDSAFGGSTSQLVLQALTTRQASEAELVEIRRLLADNSQSTGGPVAGDEE